MSTDTRGVRILKYSVRVSPWISIKDPRPRPCPQILTILVRSQSASAMTSVARL
jgi:hypothetical protein